MKTILAVFTKEKLSSNDVLYKKEYAYNTKADLTIGDLIEAPELRGKVQITKIYYDPFMYVDKQGSLYKHNVEEGGFFPIKEINAVTINTNDDENE